MKRDKDKKPSFGVRVNKRANEKKLKVYIVIQIQRKTNTEIIAVFELALVITLRDAFWNEEELKQNKLTMLTNINKIIKTKKDTKHQRCTQIVCCVRLWFPFGWKKRCRRIFFCFSSYSIFNWIFLAFARDRNEQHKSILVRTKSVCITKLEPNKVLLLRTH